MLEITLPFPQLQIQKEPVVIIADMCTLEVEVDVSESNVSKIGVDKTVVRLDAFDNEIFLEEWYEWFRP